MTVGDTVVANPPTLTSLRYAYTLYDVVMFDLDSLAASVDGAAETLTDARIDSLLQYTTRITDATGHVGHGGGQKLSWTLLMSFLDKLEIDFNAAGQPDLPMLVAERDKRNILPYPPVTDAERAMVDEWIARKRKEFDARRGRS